MMTAGGTAGGGMSEANNSAQLKSKDLQLLQQQRDFINGSDRGSINSGAKFTDRGGDGNPGQNSATQMIGEKIGNMFSFFTKK